MRTVGGAGSGESTETARSRPARPRRKSRRRRRAHPNLSGASRTSRSRAWTSSLRLYADRLHVRRDSYGCTHPLQSKVSPRKVLIGPLDVTCSNLDVELAPTHALPAP